MKKYLVSGIVFVVAFAAMFPWSIITYMPPFSLQWLAVLSLSTLLGALILLTIFHIIKDFIVGKDVDSLVVMKPRDKQKAHQLLYLALGLFIISTLSSVLPYITDQPGVAILTPFAAVCTLGGLFALHALSKYQANMYWVRLKNAASLDERQLRERLSIMQKAYVASAVLLAAFLVLGALFLPNIIFGMIDCGGDGSLGMCKDFDWTPYINMMLVVLWMPSIVAALQLPQKATE